MILEWQLNVGSLRSDILSPQRLTVDKIVAVFLLLSPPADDKIYEDRDHLETLLAKVQENDYGRRMPVSTNDNENEFEASAIEEDFEEIVDDLATYMDCLMDLAPALENPASDYNNQTRQTKQTESFNVSTALAADYCCKIRDRFINLDIRLVERLGEANALRKQRIQQRPQVAQDTDKEDNDIDVNSTSERQSEPMFSDEGPKISVPTGSTFPSSQPLESIFDGPLPKKLISSDSMSSVLPLERPNTSDGDTASQAIFASFSTISSTRSQGRPRVPPLPVDAGSNNHFTCVACGKDLLATRTRRAWK